MTRGLAMLFSLRSHTFLHGATQASHLTEPIPTQLRCPQEQVLNHHLQHPASTASTAREAALLGTAGKVQTASLQWPGEVAAELHHLNAHWKDLERIARSIIRIYYFIHRIRGRELVKKKTTYQDLYFNILLKLSALHFRATYPLFLQGPAEQSSHLAWAGGDSANTAHSHCAIRCAREDNLSSAHRSHFILGLNP